ncbi:hypothetical protein COOONC_08203 [Cooperia oncophora]
MSSFSCWEQQFNKRSIKKRYHSCSGGKERGHSLCSRTSLLRKKPSNQNLQLLNSRQALEDVATFIQSMNKVYNFKDPKWIVFGGSRSLALWARQKYPELIAGAVGSSPLLQPKVDFWEYIEMAEQVYRRHDNKCGQNIQIAFAQVIDMLNTKLGREQLSRTVSM